MNAPNHDDDMEAVRDLAQRLHISSDPYELDPASIKRVLDRGSAARPAAHRRLWEISAAAFIIAVAAAAVGIALLTDGASRTPAAMPTINVSTDGPRAPSSVRSGTPSPVGSSSSPGVSNKTPAGLTTLLSRADTVALVSLEFTTANSATAHVHELFKGDLVDGSTLALGTQPRTPSRQHVLFMHGSRLIADFVATTDHGTTFRFAGGTNGILDELSLKDLRVATTRER